MEAVLCLNESPQMATILQNIRAELTSAVRTALLAQAYDTDIQLSFGIVHINSDYSGQLAHALKCVQRMGTAV